MFRFTVLSASFSSKLQRCLTWEPHVPVFSLRPVVITGAERLNRALEAASAADAHEHAFEMFSVYRRPLIDSAGGILSANRILEELPEGYTFWLAQPRLHLLSIAIAP